MTLSKTKEFWGLGAPRHGPKSVDRSAAGLRKPIARNSGSFVKSWCGSLVPWRQRPAAPCGAHVVPMWCSPSGPSDVHWIHWPLVDKWKILPWTMSIFLPETQLGTWSGKSNGERPPKFDGRIEKRSEIPWSARESTASAEACYTPLAWQNWKMMMTRTKNAGPFVCAPRWQQVASDFLVTLRCHAWGVIDGVGIDVDSLRALKKAGRRQFQWLKVKDDDSMVFKLLTHLNSLNYGQIFLVSYGTFNFQYSFCIVLLVKNRSSVFGLSPPFLCFTSWSVAGWV